MVNAFYYKKLTNVKLYEREVFTVYIIIVTTTSYIEEKIYILLASQLMFVPLKLVIFSGAKASAKIKKYKQN